jgi:hypothetical protein
MAAIGAGCHGLCIVEELLPWSIPGRRGGWAVIRSSGVGCVAVGLATWRPHCWDSRGKRFESTAELHLSESDWVCLKRDTLG